MLIGSYNTKNRFFVDTVVHEFIHILEQKKIIRNFPELEELKKEFAKIKSYNKTWGIAEEIFTAIIEGKRSPYLNEIFSLLDFNKEEILKNS